MRSLYLLLAACCLLPQLSAAQSRSAAPKPKPKATAPKPAPNIYAEVDAKALQAPDSATTTTAGIAAYINSQFSRNSDKVRAAFIWVASNIQYDLNNMFALNFYEKKEEKIEKALKTRKGICENYAVVFQDICTKAGIKSYVIEGYTRQNGFVDYIPHAWCAALTDTGWALFDPTWGSGYIQNKQFVKKISNRYFAASGTELIKSHMPFDYLWQLLPYPLSSQEFYDGKTQPDPAKPFFNYADSIAAFEKQDRISYYAEAARRLETAGVKNSMCFDRLQYLRREIEIDAQNNIVYHYNGALARYNNAVNAFNDYINFYNKQFKPERSDAEIQAMINECSNELKQATDRLNKIKKPDANTTALITGMRKQIGDLSTRVNEQQEWLNKYFAKGRSGRRSMFVKYTWFGVPLN
ncbi:MAG TPA: transglutaminase domain-containing protein [Chitinophaga sp.]|uniref:transglutaminase domain-containing protein n=1 Tax=Chitinophaga sp. TaxID=1869181 RepID=UPI002F91D5F0